MMLDKPTINLTTEKFRSFLTVIKMARKLN